MCRMLPRSSFVPLLAAVLCVCATCTAVSSPLDVVKLMHPSDTVLVYVVEAPLFKSQFGDKLAALNAFHSGLYFRNSQTKNEWTVEYTASQSVLASVFPDMYHNGSGIDLEWFNGAHVELSSGYNATYWTKRTLAMEMLGAVANDYLCGTMLYYNTTMVNYQLFQVIQSHDVNHLYLPSSTCYDFVRYSIEMLYNAGAVYASSLGDKLHQDVVVLYASSAPTIVDESDPGVHQALVSFYEAFMYTSTNQSAEDWLHQVVQSVGNGNWYYYYCTSDGSPCAYYAFPVAEPYANFTYFRTPIPKGSPNPTAVPSWNSHACPYESLRIDAGSIVLFVFFSCLCIYVGVGMVWNLHQNRTGMQLLPHYMFWFHFMRYVRDGWYVWWHFITCGSCPREADGNRKRRSGVEVDDLFFREEDEDAVVSHQDRDRMDGYEPFGDGEDRDGDDMMEFRSLLRRSGDGNGVGS